jgi:hypothetical protein
MSRAPSVNRRSRRPVWEEKTAIPGAFVSVDLATNVAGYAAAAAAAAVVVVGLAVAAAPVPVALLVLLALLLLVLLLLVLVLLVLVLLVVVLLLMLVVVLLGAAVRWFEPQPAIVLAIDATAIRAIRRVLTARWPPGCASRRGFAPAAARSRSRCA